MATPLYLGIDLGTTNSTAAAFDGEQLTLIRTAQGGNLTPSVVRLDARGTVTVGERARRLLDSDPQNTRSEFKRLMGTTQTLEFTAAKLSRRPEELSAEVLKSLRKDVEQQLGVAPTCAVISVPALFELPQNAATSEAARLAGFSRVELIQEPVASALAAGWRADADEGSWLVYDLGGGTFDVSLLETRDGLLRVVGHDGDNFLGGRDFDQALVDEVLAELQRTQGIDIRRADPRHATALRKLKHAVEEAKIELSRANEVPLLVPAAFETDQGPVDVDMLLTRERMEAACAPLVKRSLDVCLRLLSSQGLEPSQLGKVVLVGGPTVMPFLRAQVQSVLGAPFAVGLDPMTLVAQGAALYAASAGLDGRPAASDPVPQPTGRKVWLQYPAMSSDLSPHVVGRMVEGDPGPRPTHVRLVRTDGAWSSPETPLSAEGAFVLSVELVPRKPNHFQLEGRGADGKPLPLSPARFTIVQGLTLSDPPLSRSIGVALANNTVRVYFERGTPLPARRTFRQRTVEAVAKGSTGHALRIPIVQGELEWAHLCRLVGALELRGEQLQASLPSDAEVELTLELDRGGRLSARALVPALGQVFEQVAQLQVPDATPESLQEGLTAARERLGLLRGSAFRRGASQVVAGLAHVDQSLAEVERDLEAARGGDADAAQKARRGLLDLDAQLEQAESGLRWPELEETAREELALASSWVAQFGTPVEQRLLDDAMRACERASAGRQAVELQRNLRSVRKLCNAAYFRHPSVWEWQFESAASRVSEASDVARAEELVQRGNRALAQQRREELRQVVEQLWRLLPEDAKERRLAHDSGVR
ncbi:Hsp70 family protein [Cystobacter fuscus]|uniref:Hsp70 family protein n=1 Tax=Cystobacter fuscus TaxID=43 RepID=UPI002B2ABCF0|nr:Hsp70 family protein [Cystobacter fuscus]